MREFTLTVNGYQLQTLQQALARHAHAINELLTPVNQMLQAAQSAPQEPVPAPPAADPAAPAPAEPSAPDAAPAAPGSAHG